MGGVVVSFEIDRPVLGSKVLNVPYARDADLRFAVCALTVKQLGDGAANAAVEQHLGIHTESGLRGFRFLRTEMFGGLYVEVVNAVRLQDLGRGDFGSINVNHDWSEGLCHKLECVSGADPVKLTG
jgi:hypothetical protein